MADGQGAVPQYFVQGDEGKLYGPATAETLKSWVAEGRVLRDTVLVHADTKESFRAADVEGLFETAAASEPPPVQGGAPPPMAPPPGYYSPPAPKSKTGVWLIALVAVAGICVFGCAIFAAILFPVFSQARGAARRTIGLTRMKQLSVAVLIYQNDFDEKYPRDMSSADALRAPVGKYVKDPTVFETANPKGGEILGNGRLSGKDGMDVLTPNDVVMVYDSLPWDNGVGLAGYADGHAMVVRPYENLAKSLARDPFK
jgi:hypothetical protein